VDDNDRQQMLKAINAQRAQFGAPPLTLDARLNASAQEHSQRMADANVMAHQLPGEPDPGQRITNAGYHFSWWAENIEAGLPTADQAAAAWFNETPPNDGHRKNNLNPQLVNIGVGHVYKEGTTYGHYWTADFGRPA
jgi:uncharacterized protein YkwD